MVGKKHKKKNKESLDELDSNNTDIEYDETESQSQYEDHSVPKWFEQLKNEPDNFELCSDEDLVSYRIEAQKVLEDETKWYHSKSKKNSESRWMKTVLQKGTSGDKIAAMILLIQNSPVHNLSSLMSLVGMVKSAKKKQCENVMENLAELFVMDLLKPGLKLKKFNQHPFDKLTDICSGNAISRRQRLATWLFEERLKEIYQQFIMALDALAKDTVESFRSKSVSIMNYLLMSHPENEEFLLRNIINKLGDPVQKVVSKVIYCLTQLLRTHPNMKQVVMNEVEKFLFRPNISSRAQYYSICFLSQFIFSNEDREVARNVINIYFSFFKASIKKGEVDSRLMGSLLMGVKRAHPFAKLETNSLSQHIDTLYKLVHLTSFNISLHTLCLLEQISVNMEERFYSAFYKKILDSNLAKSTHQALFINLTHKALSKDENLARVKSFIKRLLQICCYSPVPLTCGILYMLSNILTKRKLLMEREITENKVALAVKLEDYINDDNDEEKYIDADKIAEENDETAETSLEGEKEDKKPIIGWQFVDITKKPHSFLYDPKVRNPTYANAENSAYYELVDLTKHFHPTVALFAQKILNGEHIIYSGDPLNDFTLIRFLERFVFKNPKKQTKTDGDLRGPDPKLAPRKYYTPSGAKGLDVKSVSYLKQEERNVPVDELFLFRYIKDKYADKIFESDAKKKENEDFSDNDSVNSDEFLDFLDEMSNKKSSKTKLNFMDDIGDNLKNKNKRKDIDSDQTDDEDDNISDQSDNEDEISNIDIDENDNVMSDDEAIDFESDGSEHNISDIDIDEVINSKSGNKKKKLKRKSSNDINDLFAPAEEFAEILEDAGHSKNKLGMSNTLQNFDNADTKQLNWELNRNRWMKGINNKKRKIPHFKNKSKNIKRKKK